MQPDSSVHFNPIFDSFLLIVVIAIVLLSLLVLVPSFRDVNIQQKRLLAMLRAVVVLLVLLALLRPALVATAARREPGTLIVLADRSRSMQVTDAPEGSSRWKALKTTILRSLPELNSLRTEVEVKVYTFDARPQVLPWKDETVDLGERADGGQSDIGVALVEAVRGELGKRVIGVILLSDGAPRVYEPHIEVRDAARELVRLGYPLFTLTFGLPREKSQARDIAIENLQDHYSVFVKNELELRASLRAQGFVNKQLPVEMIVEASGGSREVVATKTVQPTENGELVDIRFQYVPQDPGQYRLTVRAPPQPGEMVTKNNELTSYVTVREGGLKVLYLYGSLVGEQLFLRKSINDSPDLQLDGLSIDHGFRDNWPLTIDSLHGNGNYDVYIVESVHAQALGPKNLDHLVDTVEQGKGLLMIGGVYSFGAGGYQRSRLADIFPIKMHRFERQNFDAPVRPDLHIEGPLNMLPTTPEFVTRLAPDADNRSTWDGLPPLDGANRFNGLKVGATVMAESPAGDPLLVHGSYGSGRVLVFAGDTTWKWWTHGNQLQHKRFWRQVVLWLAQREDSFTDDVWIRLPQRRYPPLAAVMFTVGATSNDDDPVLGASFRAELIQPDGNRQPLRLFATDEAFSGEWKAATEPGDYAIEVTAMVGNRELGRARESFAIFDHDLELRDPAANPALLASLAGITREAGGRALAPEELPTLLRELGENITALEVEVQAKWQFADRPADAWPFFLVVVLLLGCEWYLRKKWGLV